MQPLPSAASAPGRRAPLAWLVLSVAAGLTVVWAAREFMGPEYLLCFILGALVAAPVVARWWAGAFDLFEPATIIAGVYFVYFVFAPAVRFATDDLTFIGRDFSGDYVRGLLAVLLAVGAMWAGYALPLRSRPPRPSADRDTEVAAARQLAWWLVAAAFVGMVAWARIAGKSLLTFFLPGLARGGGGEGSGPDIAYLFLSIEWFIPALTVLFVMGGLRTRWRRAAALLFVTVVYVSIGFRYRIVVLWLATAIATYLRRGRRPQLRNLLLPGAAVFLFAGWLAQARAFFRSGGTTGSLTFSLRETTLAGLSDTRIFETFAAVTRVIPAFVGYAGITPIVYPLLLPIPRALWPDKPLPYWLALVGNSIGTPESAAAGAAVPHFGEFYIAYGWPGIAVGMFVFGAAAKYLWRYYQAAPSDPWRQIVFSLNGALLFQLIIRGYLAQLLQEWCFIVLPAMALAALARRRARTASLTRLAAVRAGADEPALGGAPSA